MLQLIRNNLRANAVDYDEVDVVAAEMELEYA